MNEEKKSSWDKVWTALTALAAAAALYFSYQQEKDAAINRVQQQNITQGTIMSQCMDEYNHICQDASTRWPSSDLNTSNSLQSEFSKRLYSLHFQEYHLFFPPQLIPEHVYCVWLYSLREESRRPDVAYPPLDTKVFTNHIDPDFKKFMQKVLFTDTPIETLVSNECASRPDMKQ
jgi:hypothetical protein